MTKNHTKAVEAEVEATEELITPKQLASELGTDPKTFRRFLRGLTEDRAGKGGRWTFDADTAESIRKAWADRATKGTNPELADATDEA